MKLGSFVRPFALVVALSVAAVPLELAAQDIKVKAPKGRVDSLRLARNVNNDQVLVVLEIGARIYATLLKPKGKRYAGSKAKPVSDKGAEARRPGAGYDVSRDEFYVAWDTGPEDLSPFNRSGSSGRAESSAIEARRVKSRNGKGLGPVWTHLDDGNLNLAPEFVFEPDDTPETIHDNPISLYNTALTDLDTGAEARPRILRPGTRPAVFMGGVGGFGVPTGVQALGSGNLVIHNTLGYHFSGDSTASGLPGVAMGLSLDAAGVPTVMMFVRQDDGTWAPFPGTPSLFPFVPTTGGFWHSIDIHGISIWIERTGPARRAFGEAVDVKANVRLTTPFEVTTGPGSLLTLPIFPFGTGIFRRVARADNVAHLLSAAADGTFRYETVDLEGNMGGGDVLAKHKNDIKEMQHVLVNEGTQMLIVWSRDKSKKTDEVRAVLVDLPKTAEIR